MRIFTNGTNRYAMPDDAKLTDWPGYTEEIDTAGLAAEIRAERNALLVEADILHAIAYDKWVLDNTDTGIEAVVIYRSALRDIPEQDGFPTNITWPTKPE